MSNENYKWLSLALAIIALIFIVLFFTKEDDSITQTLGNVSEEIEVCQAELAEWQSANVGTTSAESQDELNDILDRCNNILENEQDKL